MAALCLLAEDVLLQIIGQLDLRSISRLSRSCRFLSILVRSHSAFWRSICKDLIGNWIYRPELVSDQLQLTDYPRPPNPPIPLDWSQDPNCFPLSHFTCASSSQPTQINSWYDFATRYLIPHRSYLGWHISINDLDRNELILITYDIYSGRLIAEQVKCRNLHTSLDHPPFAGANGELSTDHRMLPSRLISLEARNQIRLQPNGFQYTIAPGVASPHSEFAFDIFTPDYVSSPFFSISPFPPQYTFSLTKHCTTLGNQPKPSVQFTFPKPTSCCYPLDCHMPSAPRALPDPIITRRNRHLSAIVSQGGMMSLGNLGQRFLHHFALDGIPAKQSSYISSPVDQDPRIRYQGGPPPRRVDVSDIIVAGRTYRSTETGSIAPVVHSTERLGKYFLVNGPSINEKIKPSCFDGLWVGSRGNQTHMGLINIRLPPKDSLMQFAQLLKDTPAVDREWGVFFSDRNPFRSVSLDEAIEFDTNVGLAHDGGWIKGFEFGELAREMSVSDIQVQFIRKDATEDQLDENPSVLQVGHINQIRVKWANKIISSYFKVGFL